MSEGLWTGVEAIQAGLDKARQRKNEGIVQGLGIALQNTLDVSNSQVPHEEGDLERDGAWSVDKDALRGAVSYGRRSDTKDYAVPQHERMDYHHDGGRNAKFLENAVNSTREANLEIIGRAVRSKMES